MEILFVMQCSIFNLRRKVVVIGRILAANSIEKRSNIHIIIICNNELQGRLANMQQIGAVHKNSLMPT